MPRLRLLQRRLRGVRRDHLTDRGRPGRHRARHRLMFGSPTSPSLRRAEPGRPPTTVLLSYLPPTAPFVMPYCVSPSSPLPTWQVVSLRPAHRPRRVGRSSAWPAGSTAAHCSASADASPSATSGVQHDAISQRLGEICHRTARRASRPHAGCLVAQPADDPLDDLAAAQPGRVAEQVVQLLHPHRTDAPGARSIRTRRRCPPAHRRSASVPTEITPAMGAAGPGPGGSAMTSSTGAVCDPMVRSMERRPVRARPGQSSWSPA